MSARPRAVSSTSYGEELKSSSVKFDHSDLLLRLEYYIIYLISVTSVEIPVFYQ